MRLPNGYGSVTKLSGNRRRPYMVKKTVGWNEKGHPIYEIIGYTETRDDGLQLLAEYNHDPWDIDKSKITFSELFEVWKRERMPKLGSSNQESLRAAYNHCSNLYNAPYKQIKAAQMQDCIDNCRRGYATQAAIKNLFNHLDKFAKEWDITSNRYSELLTCEPIPETTRERFSVEEINTIWEHQNDPWMDSVLVFIYSGWRISELLNLKKSDIDLTAGTMTGGVKSKNGKNRIVPIHSLIRPFIERRMASDGEYLFSYNKKQCSKTWYYSMWKDIMKRYGIDKTPHECRHTFESLLDAAGANRKCIDLMMGHKSKDTGNRVYNHKTLQDLKNAIELVRR